MYRILCLVMFKRRCVLLIYLNLDAVSERDRRAGRR